MKTMGMWCVAKSAFRRRATSKAVHAGHQGVEQDDVGQAFARALQGGFAVGGDEHGVARFVERVVQQREVFRDVVDDQDDVRDVARSLRGISGFLRISFMASNWNWRASSRRTRTNSPCSYSQAFDLAQFVENAAHVAEVD
jgi:hypothetical protein